MQTPSDPDLPVPADAAPDPADATTVDLNAPAPPTRPPAPPPHPRPRPRRRSWRPPAWLWAPSALYAVSAACILYGVAQIIVPVYDAPWLSVEKFYSLAALNLYEVALLAVALLVVLWRKVYDDAVTLTVLVGLFMIASATALDTVAPDFREPALLFGIAGVLMAGAKVYSLDRLILAPLGWGVAAALGVLLVWNFLMPAVLGFNQANDVIHDALREVWLGGWCVTLVGGAVLVATAAATPTGDLGADDEGQPFLRRAAMGWIVVGVVLAGTITHQYALTWAFGLRVEVGDLLPGVALAALVLLELVRGYGCRFNALDEAVALAPLAVAAVVISGDLYTTDLREHLGLVSYPPVVLGAVALWLGVVACRSGQRSMQVVSTAYALTAALTVGVNPHVGWAGSGLNWSALGYSTAAVLAVFAAAWRRPTLGAWSAAVLAVTFALHGPVYGWCDAHRLAAPAVAATVFGLITVGLYAACRRSLPRALGMAGATCLAAGVLHCTFRASSGLYAPFTAAVVVLALTAPTAVWTRDWRLLLPGCTPMAAWAYDFFSDRRGWLFVALSFIVRAGGALSSVMKDHSRRPRVAGPGPADDPAPARAKPAPG